jgi:hypothetical protein
MGSYTIDSHNIQRYITPEGYVQNEGDIGVSTGGPYKIAYGALTPKKEECTNLYAPLAASASHIAYGSIRMEPVFMITGQSAATAASLAIAQDIAVQDVAYDQLRERLLADGQILEYDGPRGHAGPHGAKGTPIATLDGIVIDNSTAARTGFWKSSSSNAGFIGTDYAHDDKKADAKTTMTFSAEIEDGGTYEIRIAHIPNNNRAANAAVSVSVDGEVILETTVNQQLAPPIDDHWTALTTHKLEGGAKVEVVLSGKDADGYVIADAVQILAAE